MGDGEPIEVEHKEYVGGICRFLCCGNAGNEHAPNLILAGTGQCEVIAADRFDVVVAGCIVTDGNYLALELQWGQTDVTIIGNYT